jgi:hypothetical protein
MAIHLCPAITTVALPFFGGLIIVRKFTDTTALIVRVGILMRIYVFFEGEYALVRYSS